MTASIFSSRFSRWLVSSLALLLVAGLGVAPVHAQDGSGGDNTQELKKRLQASYKAGAQAGNQGNYETAISRFEEAIEVAQQLELDDIVQKIQSNLINSFKSAGSADLKQENYEQALAHFDRALEYADNDPSVYHNRGIAYFSMDSTDAALESMQTAIKVGNETGNTRVAGMATERVRGHFLNLASQALNADNLSSSQISTALEALDEMENYVDPNAQSLFYRALALFEQGNLQEAIQTAQQGLDMHDGSRSDAAKFYFVIAESQMMTGNQSQACETFKNAAYGDYQARAEHYLKNDCDS
jgi:tetratricopeptide (TPR) repeat protein